MAEARHLEAMRRKRVLVLRPEGQDERLAALLRARHAEAVSIPAIEIIPAAPSVITETLARATDNAWGVFTSVNGVRIVTGAARGPLPFAAIAAIGPATADALARAGVPVRWVPEVFTTDALAAGLPGPPGDVALFRAASADTRLDVGLAARGFRVTRVDAYDTRAVNGDRIAQVFADGVDAVALTSASIARAAAPTIRAVGEDVLVCCIGPETAAAARAEGIRVDTVAATHTIDGVLDALDEAFGRSACL